MQKISIIESTTFNDKTAEQFSRRRREQYQKLLDRSEERIAEIKSRIAEDIGAKKLQLENYKNERTQVNTRYKFGEIPYEQHEKIENSIKKKFDKVKTEAITLEQLYRASSSSEIGGLIQFDIDKDVDAFGNIIRKSGMQVPTIPKTIPAKFSIPGGVTKNRKNVIIIAIVALIFLFVCGYILTITQGGATAQYERGNRYYSGEGGERDYAKAVESYTKAAAQGHVEAQYELGNRYYSGEGVGRDYAKAVEWWTKAAVQGHVKAQYELGNCYYHGYGVREDYEKAVEWWAKAAEQGHAEAQFSLGVCYYYGYGVWEDEAKAAEWYTKAAEQGHEKAQHNLGLCYANGYGVVQNYDQAIYWFTQAVEQGHTASQGNLNYLLNLVEGGQGYESTCSGGLACAAEEGRKHAQRVEDLLNQLGW